MGKRERKESLSGWPSIVYCVVADEIIAKRGWEMAERKSGSRVTISGLERFFSEDMAGSKDLTDAKLEELHSFPGHPFRIVDDEAMNELSSSIRKNGVLNPLMVRKRDGGGYEIISGHRRKRAAELAELEKIPVRVLDISDEEAVLYMVDSNIQREDVLPSEKARSLMRLAHTQMPTTSVEWMSYSTSSLWIRCFCRM